MSDVMKQRLHALREAAESLDSSQFQALSTGIGLGSLQAPAPKRAPVSHPQAATKSGQRGQDPGLRSNQIRPTPSRPARTMRSGSSLRWISRAGLRMLVGIADTMLFALAVGLALGLASFAAKLAVGIPAAQVIANLASLHVLSLVALFSASLLLYFLSFYWLCGGTPISLWLSSGSAAPSKRLPSGKNRADA